MNKKIVVVIIYFIFLSLNAFAMIVPFDKNDQSQPQRTTTGKNYRLKFDSANPTRKNKKDRTGLFYAALFGWNDDADRLLKSGVDPNSKDYKCRTPLHVAKNEQIVDLLLKAGARIDEKDLFQRSPLLHQIRSNCADSKIPLFMMSKGADVLLSDFMEKNALDYALDTDLLEPIFIKKLLEGGARLSHPINAEICYILGRDLFYARRAQALIVSHAVKDIFYQYGYLVFNAHDTNLCSDIYYLLKNGAKLLRKKSYSDASIKKFFKAMQEWITVPRKKRKMFAIRGALIFRYPSLQQLEDLFGKVSVQYAQEFHQSYLGQALMSTIACYDKHLYDIDYINKLVDLGVDINFKKFCGLSVLERLVVSQQLIRVKKNDDYMTYYKIADKPLEMLRFLVEKGAIISDLMAINKLIATGDGSIAPDYLRQCYDKQYCSICLEHPNDLNAIPCRNRHFGSFICYLCLLGLEQYNIAFCPLCRDCLG